MPTSDAVEKKDSSADGRRASQKRKKPSTAAEGAIDSSIVPSQADRVVIPLRSKRLRKHAALIQTPTSGFLLCCARKRETECMQSTLRLLQLYADETYGVWVKGKEEDETQNDGEDEEQASEAAVTTEPSIVNSEQEAHRALKKQSAYNTRTDALTIRHMLPSSDD